MQTVNPFIVSGKILPEYFCDRTRESAILINAVSNGNNLVLISPRRMGKTGLIRYCFDNEKLAGQYNVFFIDILQTGDLREFTFVLGKEIFDRLKSKSSRMLGTFLTALRSLSGKFGFDAISGTPTFNIQLGDITAPEYTLDEIFSYISASENRCIIAIDEFQQIAQYPEKNVEALLRTHIQNTSNANFIFAGSERHMMRRMFLSSARPFYNSATLLELDPIPLAEYSEFVSRMFALRDKSVDKEAVEYAYTTLRGNTYYMQKAFNYSFSATVAGSACGTETVEAALDDMLFSFDTIFREQLSQLSGRQKELLYAISAEGRAEAITSAAFIRNHALASASAVQAACKKLLERELIVSDGKGYRINDSLFALWLSKLL